MLTHKAYQLNYFERLPQRALIALWAISFRRLALNDFALAFPPLLAPSLLKATA